MGIHWTGLFGEGLVFLAERGKLINLFGFAYQSGEDPLSNKAGNLWFRFAYNISSKEKAYVSWSINDRSYTVELIELLYGKEKKEVLSAGQPFVEITTSKGLFVLEAVTVIRYRPRNKSSRKELSGYKVISVPEGIFYREDLVLPIRDPLLVVQALLDFTYI